MIPKINEWNYSSYLNERDELIISSDSSFFSDDTGIKQIKITGLKEKALNLLIINLEKPDLEIFIDYCSFRKIEVQDSKFLKLFLINVEVSNSQDSPYFPYDLKITSSKINVFWCDKCHLFGGVSIKKSEFGEIRFAHCNIDSSFILSNSISKNIEFESVVLDELSLTTINYNNKNQTVKIDEINIFRTEIKKSLRIEQVEFKKISIYKLLMHETSNMRDSAENILQIQYFDELNVIERIDIHESSIHCNSILYLTNAISIDSTNTTFKNISFNFTNIGDFSFKNNRINEDIFFGYPDTAKEFTNFEFNNCNVIGEFSFRNIYIKKKLHISGSSFSHSPSFFTSNDIAIECSINFKYTNLNCLIFQNIDFSHFSFKNIEISGGKFEECFWESEKGFLLDRFRVIDENNVNRMELNELIQLKKIYTNLKLNFRANQDYITSGKFYVSEQEIKRRISKKNKSKLEYFILTVHKNISSYGENVYKPFVWILMFSAIFAVVYIFTGFYAGERVVLYELEFDSQNIVQTTIDWTFSFILSIKNILPFSFEKNFFLDINKDFALSQFFELLQKFIFMVLIGSFTEAFVRYLKK